MLSDVESARLAADLLTLVVARCGCPTARHHLERGAAAWRDCADQLDPTTKRPALRLIKGHGPTLTTGCVPC
jgi:hypothetical protein